MLEVIFVCLLTGIAAGIIGASKGRSGFGWFLIGFFLNLIGVLIAIGVPSLKPVVIAGSTLQPSQRRDSDFILCHACGRPRRVDAYACPHCRAGDPDPRAGQKKCIACAEWILLEAKKCKHCGEAQVAEAARDTGVDGFMGYCPGCGKLRNSTVPTCVYCKDSGAVTKGPPASASSISWREAQ